MKWEKRGLVFAPAGESPWMNNSAMVPTPLLLDDGRLRIFIGMRDSAGVGRVGYVDVNAADPGEVQGVSARPSLDIGEAGTFDDNGVLPVSVVRDGARLYLFYVGFQEGVKVRFYQFAGLAVSDDQGESFRRVQRVPILDRSDEELFSRAAPFGMKEGETWKLYYAAADHWEALQGKDIPRFTIKYLESDAVTRWGGVGRVCFSYKSADEHTLARPFVTHESGDRYRMFYASKSHSERYRLGYAESFDGIEWTRKDDEIGIEVSAFGWDSDEMMWPSVFRHGEIRYLFYNGNNYGRDGFGYAVLTDGWH